MFEHMIYKLNDYTEFIASRFEVITVLLNIANDQINF